MRQRLMGGGYSLRQKRIQLTSPVTQEDLAQLCLACAHIARLSALTLADDPEIIRTSDGQYRRQLAQALKNAPKEEKL